VAVANCPMFFVRPNIGAKRFCPAKQNPPIGPKCLIFFPSGKIGQNGHIFLNKICLFLYGT